MWEALLRDLLDESVPRTCKVSEHVLELSWAWLLGAQPQVEADCAARWGIADWNASGHEGTELIFRVLRRHFNSYLMNPPLFPGSCSLWPTEYMFCCVWVIAGYGFTRTPAEAHGHVVLARVRDARTTKGCHTLSFTVQVPPRSAVPVVHHAVRTGSGCHAPNLGGRGRRVSLSGHTLQNGPGQISVKKKKSVFSSNAVCRPGLGPALAEPGCRDFK
eukprot:6161742-Prymnesium_polylepis.1